MKKWIKKSKCWSSDFNFCIVFDHFAFQLCGINLKRIVKMAQALMKMAPPSKSAVSVPIIILSDSDSDAEDHSVSQRATQPQKRSATSASGNTAKEPRYSNCRDCNSKCVVQVDQTLSNSGRKVNFPSLQFLLKICFCHRMAYVEYVSVAF
jgi:hypothetical protein